MKKLTKKQIKNLKEEIATTLLLIVFVDVIPVAMFLHWLHIGY